MYNIEWKSTDSPQPEGSYVEPALGPHLQVSPSTFGVIVTGSFQRSVVLRGSSVEGLMIPYDVVQEQNRRENIRANRSETESSSTANDSSR